jgi:hypothetical protein
MAQHDAEIQAAIASGQPDQVVQAQQAKTTAINAWNLNEQNRLTTEAAASQAHVNAMAMEERKAEIAREAATLANQNEIAKAAQAAKVASAQSIETSNLQTAQKYSDQSAMQAQTAQQVLSHLQTLRAIEPSLSKSALPLTPEVMNQLAPALDFLHIGTPATRAQLSGAQIFSQAAQAMAPLLRPQGVGRYSTQEMMLNLNSLPTNMESHDARMLALGTLEKAAQQNVNVDADTQDYIARNHAIATPPVPATAASPTLPATSLNQMIQSKYGNQSLYDAPPAFTGDLDSRRAQYKTWADGHLPGEPFFGIEPGTGRHVLGYRDPQRAGTPFVYLPQAPR